MKMEKSRFYSLNEAREKCSGSFEVTVGAGDLQLTLSEPLPGDIKGILHEGVAYFLYDSPAELPLFVAPYKCGFTVGSFKGTPAMSPETLIEVLTSTSDFSGLYYFDPPEGEGNPSWIRWAILDEEAPYQMAFTPEGLFFRGEPGREVVHVLEETRGLTRGRAGHGNTCRYSAS